MTTKELVEELSERLEDIEQAKTKPGHGVCCTCQECGHCHDDCTCYDEKVSREIIKRLEEREELKRVVNDPHITQDETMRRLLQLCSN